MKKLFAMARYNKKLMWLLIFACFNLFVVCGVVVFDLIELILIKNNRAMLSACFVGFNIALILFLVIDIVLLVTYILIRNKKGK